MTAFEDKPIILAFSLRGAIKWHLPQAIRKVFESYVLSKTFLRVCLAKHTSLVYFFSTTVTFRFGSSPILSVVTSGWSRSSIWMMRR
jgi:hypothetical protein